MMALRALTMTLCLLPCLSLDTSVCFWRFKACEEQQNRCAVILERPCACHHYPHPSGVCQRLGSAQDVKRWCWPVRCVEKGQWGPWGPWSVEQPKSSVRRRTCLRLTDPMEEMEEAGCPRGTSSQWRQGPSQPLFGSGALNATFLVIGVAFLILFAIFAALRSRLCQRLAANADDSSPVTDQCDPPPPYFEVVAEPLPSYDAAVKMHRDKQQFLEKEHQ